MLETLLVVLELALLVELELELLAEVDETDALVLLAVAESEVLLLGRTPVPT